MTIEYVKPPVTPKKELKLAGLGVSLVVLGLLGTSYFPAVSSGAPVNNITTVTADGATLTFNAGTVAYEATQVLMPQGHQLLICEADATRCDNFGSAIASVPFSEGVTSITLYSDDRKQNGELIGVGTFQAQLLFYTRTPSSEVSVDVMRTVTTIVRPAQGTPPGPSSGSSEAPAPPPISLDISGVASASALQAGKRDFTFEGSNMEDVVAIRVNGKSLPLFARKSDSVKVRLPNLGPGKYSVKVYTETGNWEIQDAIEIGEYLPEVRREVLDESFQKYSSELPKQTKQEIRSVIESTPNLKSVTVFAIAKREIIGEDRNKLARSRGAEAFDFVQKLAPDARIKVKLVHYSETDLTPRGLFFRVAQKG